MTLLDEIDSPVDVSVTLQDHFPEIHASDIAVHVYQPLLEAIKALEARIEQLECPTEKGLAGWDYD